MALKNKDDYPLILTAGDISEILAVSKPTAYELMENPSFPLIRIGRNKRVLCPKIRHRSNDQIRSLNHNIVKKLI